MPSNVTQGERLATLEAQVSGLNTDRAEIWAELTKYKVIVDGRFEELRKVLLGRPTWAVMGTITFLATALGICVTGILTYVLSH